MKFLGLIQQDLEINPGTDYYENWDDLSDADKRLQARKMEVCAAMIELLHEGIGEVVEHLTKAGEYENTIILFMSDNGANPKDPHFYSNLTPEEIDELFDNSWRTELGREGSFISIGGAWAEACNTPLSYFKLTTSEGGVQVPLIVSGPGIERRGVVTDQLLHVTDVLPTLLDYAGVGAAQGSRRTAVGAALRSILARLPRKDLTSAHSQRL